VNRRENLGVEVSLDVCLTDPDDLEECLDRLKEFVWPYAGMLYRRELRGHCEDFVRGLLSDLSRKSTEPIAERASLEMAVKEKTMPFGRSTTAAGADAASLSAGDVLHEELRANGWTEKQAAEKLGLSERIMESLLAETTTVTKSTARRVAGLLSARYSLSGGAKELLGQWLLNGLQFRKLRRESGRTGSMRTAARPNRIGGQARKKKK